jgi:hypothetical protein
MAGSLIRLAFGRILAEDRRLILFRSLVFGVALLAVPPLRTGLVDFLLVSVSVPSPAGPALALALAFWLALFTLPLVPLFVVWSVPGATAIGLPRRAIAALFLLVLYHPFRYYLDGKFYGAETLAAIAHTHEQFPIVWVFKHLDTAFLLGLAVWATRRRRTAQPVEKVWFHWLLFVSALWAAGAFFDMFVGDSLMLIFG